MATVAHREAEPLAPAEPERLARRLATELMAPVGLLVADGAGGSWVARVGAPAAAFPTIGADVIRALRASDTDSPGVEALGPIQSGGSSVLWILFPVHTTAGPFVAAAGFAARHAHPEGSAVRWGPCCPIPALKAWCESQARKHEPPRVATMSARRMEAGSRVSPGSSRWKVDGADGMILARLIRRFRISDTPHRFQQLACNALRSGLRCEAVAWAPTTSSEPVVVSSETGKPGAGEFRALAPVTTSDLVVVSNAAGSAPVASVRRMIAVASDSQGSLGWLIAVNTLDDRDFSSAQAGLMQPVASLIATQQTNARVYADLKELLFGVIRALTAAIDAKDPYTCGHSERVARIAVRLAEELNVSASKRSDLYLMGLLHDVGKIGVDDAVLKKTGPLTPDEYRQIQKHVEIGVQILMDLKKLGHLLPGVRHHHESLDGTGYPCGLAGEDIPFEARILAVADAYDAMSSTRPYRRRLTPSQIDEILHKGAGTQWDPRVIDALFACRLDLEMIRQKGLGESLQVAVTGALGRP